MEYSVYTIHAVYNSVYVEYVIKSGLKLLSDTVNIVRLWVKITTEGDI